MRTESFITDKAQLVRHFEQGCKDKADWRIGTENEQFIFSMTELVRAPYEGKRGIEALLTAFINDGWQPIIEHDRVISVTNGKAFLTLEPAGQFELSGATLKTLHENLGELHSYHKQLYGHLKVLGLGLLSQGLDPKTKREDMPWMPKGRYKIMRDYMPKRGDHGLDMMTATCTVQANLDYGSEEDCGKKMRVAYALQPLVTAMFANSPIFRGQLTGFKSFRAHIWSDTDPDRSGLLPFIFNEPFTFEKYVDYALDVPMYFVYRDGIYHNHAGQSFRDFMAGKLPGREGEIPLMKDFEDHLTTVFPEVRLKQYIETRGADGGSVSHMEALSAFWTGLLYDQDTLDEAYELTRDWSFEECLQLKADATRSGLEAKFRGQPLDVTASVFVNLAKQGLINRGCKNGGGQDETIYLSYLENLISKKQCPADALIWEFKELCQLDVDLFLKAHLHQGPESKGGTGGRGDELAGWAGLLGAYF